MSGIKSISEFWERVGNERNLHFDKIYDITLPKTLINLMRMNHTRVLPLGYVTESLGNLYDDLSAQNLLSSYTVNRCKIEGDREKFCSSFNMQSLAGFKNFETIEIHKEQYVRLSDIIFSRFIEDSVLSNTVLSSFRKLPLEKSDWYYKASALHKEYLQINFNIFVRSLILNYMFIKNVFSVELEEVNGLWLYLLTSNVIPRDILKDIVSLSEGSLDDSEVATKVKNELCAKTVQSIENSLYLRFRSNGKIVLSNSVITSDEVKIFQSTSPECVHTNLTRFDLSLSCTMDKYSALSLTPTILEGIIAYVEENSETVPTEPILFEEAYQYKGIPSTKTRAVTPTLTDAPDWVNKAFDNGLLTFKENELYFNANTSGSEDTLINIGDYIILLSYNDFTLTTCLEASFETLFQKKELIIRRDAPIATSWSSKEFVFLNGTPAVIEARTDGTAGALIKAGENELLVGENAYIFGGRHDDDTLTDTSITMNGGTVKNIFGGGLHKSHTHKAEVKILGGTVKAGIHGGGAGALIKTCGCTFENDEYYAGPAEESPCITDETSVYVRGVNAGVTKPSTLVYGGGEGISYVKKTSLDIDDAKVLYVTGGGSNGRTDEAVMSVGECTSNTVIQGINRGSVGSVDMTIRSNAIGKVFAAAETPFVGTKENPNKNDPSGAVDNVKVSIYEGAQIEFTLGGNDYEVITEASPVYKNITVLENLTEAV